MRRVQEVGLESDRDWKEIESTISKMKRKSQK
jgi:hypothetical protein